MVVASFECAVPGDPEWSRMRVGRRTSYLCFAALHFLYRGVARHVSLSLPAIASILRIIIATTALVEGGPMMKCWKAGCLLGTLAGASCMAPPDEPAGAADTVSRAGERGAVNERVTDAGELAALGDRGCTWTQWGRSASHDGATCARGQDPRTILHHIVYNPFEQQEMDENFGGLFGHYQVPLNDGDGNYYMMQKGGAYVSCDPPQSGEPFPCGNARGNQLRQTWSEIKYRRRHDGSYEQVWSFASDWKPFPVFRWEPMFQPALAGPLLYVPGAGGTVWQVLDVFDRPIPIQRINPFDSIDPNTYVSGGVTVDRFGFLYWNVLRQDPETLANRGFLIKAAPWGQTWTVAYENLIPGAPAEFDPCFYTFAFEIPRPPLPWPPAADAVPPSFACGVQRPGVNVTPAVRPDGTIITASTADFGFAYAYIVALNPDLSLKWATSLRGLIHDGCGVARSNSPEGDVECSATFSAPGVDPDTNMPPALEVADNSSSTPVVVPDGGVLYGAFDAYNFVRGHLVKLDRDGRSVGTYPFGWDTTPAIYQHDGSYSIVIKDNHYFSGGPFYITQLSKDLQPEWQFQNTSTQACVRQPDGTLACTDVGPGGFEWCVNAPAVDAEGNVYANAEDGFVYQIGQGGQLKRQTFLDQALGAAYTPISLDPGGRVFALNNGELTVLGH
jgi:hypothetical protein